LKESLGRMNRYEYGKLLIFVTLILIFYTYKVNAQFSPISTPTNFIPRAHEYPTPDWRRLKRGHDFQPNYCEVVFKKGISLTEKKRLLEKIKSIGKVEDYKFPPPFKTEFYRIKISNGMSEKEAVDDLNADPAVENAGISAMFYLK
jgi:hypothetical protein